MYIHILFQLWIKLFYIIKIIVVLFTLLLVTAVVVIYFFHRKQPNHEELIIIDVNRPNEEDKLHQITQFNTSVNKKMPEKVIEYIRESNFNIYQYSL